MNTEVPQPSNLSKILTRGAFHLTLWSTIILFYVFYKLLVPIKILDIKDVPIPVTPLVVEQGGTISFVTEYCKYVDIPSIITVSFINHTLTPSLVTLRNFPTGCHVGKLDIQVPRMINPNKYKLLIFIDYNVSNLRKEHYQFFSEEFEVVATREGKLR
jgi:hypothetical protein